MRSMRRSRSTSARWMHPCTDPFRTARAIDRRSRGARSRVCSARAVMPISERTAISPSFRSPRRLRSIRTDPFAQRRIGSSNTCATCSMCSMPRGAAREDARAANEAKPARCREPPPFYSLARARVRGRSCAALELHGEGRTAHAMTHLQVGNVVDAEHEPAVTQRGPRGFVVDAPTTATFRQGTTNDRAS